MSSLRHLLSQPHGTALHTRLLEEERQNDQALSRDPGGMPMWGQRAWGSPCSAHSSMRPAGRRPCGAGSLLLRHNPAHCSCGPWSISSPCCGDKGVRLVLLLLPFLSLFCKLDFRTCFRGGLEQEESSD